MLKNKNKDLKTERKKGSTFVQKKKEEVQDYTLEAPLPPKKTTDSYGNVIFVKQKRLNELPPIQDVSLHMRKISRESTNEIHKSPIYENIHTHHTEDTYRTNKSIKDSVRTRNNNNNYDREG